MENHNGPQTNLVDATYDRKTNIERIRKNFHVTIELTDGNIYDIYFRNCGGRTEIPEQSAVLKYIFINEKLGYLPSLVENHLMYINSFNGDVVLKAVNDNNHERPYDNHRHVFELVTYDMFDGAKWTGCFKYPPST